LVFFTGDGTRDGVYDDDFAVVFVDGCHELEPAAFAVERGEGWEAEVVESVEVGWSYSHGL
jgi:hypothetical protein